jgi:quercetin dioxygenase-like cupin family protein
MVKSTLSVFGILGHTDLDHLLPTRSGRRFQQFDQFSESIGHSFKAGVDTHSFYYVNMNSEMGKHHTPDLSKIRYVPTEGAIPSEEEAEARLHQEGYESFRWYDVPGASYPKHRHSHDECIWVLKGEITFKIGDGEFKLSPGDRLYLPANAAHTASVPSDKGVTYLVGQLTRASSG